MLSHLGANVLELAQGVLDVSLRDANQTRYDQDRP
jgi:hypothetical protein